MNNTLKIFVYDEIHLNEPVKQKPVTTFVAQVFSVFRTHKVIPNLLARPPTAINAMKSAASYWLTIAFIDGSLTIKEGNRWL
jgi:hypothetical protein